MKQNNKDQNGSSSKKVNAIFYDEQTKQKIDKHLRDINDTISDEDIEKVITDISSGPSDNINIGDLENVPGNNSGDETDQIPTSWNIID